MISSRVRGSHPFAALLCMGLLGGCGGNTVGSGDLGGGVGPGSGGGAPAGTGGASNGGSTAGGGAGASSTAVGGSATGAGGATPRDAGSAARADAAQPATAAGCGTSVAVNANPFGCGFAWGANGNTGGRSAYLNLITAWVGSEANGGLGGNCTGCTMARQLATTGATAGYYAYFIGFQARAAGFGDCNTDMDGHNLCTDGAQWIRSNRDSLISMYANYAKLTYQASPNKGVAWLLEGDFTQYTNRTQTNALTMAELGQLATDIICAIKANEPNATVAINHSSWIRNPQLTSYFMAMPLSLLDFVWTTGMGNVAGGYLNTGDSFNRPDGTYAYLHMLTGKNIVVDTSFGASAQSDTWTTTDAATLNQRIQDGVVAAIVTTPPSNYQTAVAALTPQLGPTCR